MFKFKTDYKFVEYALEGKRYAVIVKVYFVDKAGKEIFIGEATISEHICVDKEDFVDCIENKVDYFTNRGKYLSYIQEYNVNSSIEGKLYIIFVSDAEYEKKLKGEVVSGHVIMNKKLYSYDVPKLDTSEGYSLENMIYEHNESWRRTCMNTFKDNLTEESNYEISIVG